MHHRPAAAAGAAHGDATAGDAAMRRGAGRNFGRQPLPGGAQRGVTYLVGGALVVATLGLLALRSVWQGGGATGLAYASHSAAHGFAAMTAAVQVVTMAGAAVVRLAPTEGRGGKAVGVGGAAAEAVTEADRESHRVLARMPLPGVPIISEEGVATAGSGVVPAGHLAPRLVVYVDPLDATQEYTEGLHQYVSVAACITLCGRAIAAVTHFPFTGRLLVALPGSATLQTFYTGQAALAALHAMPAAALALPSLPAGAPCLCDGQAAGLPPSAPITRWELPAKPPAVRRSVPASLLQRATLTLIVTRSHFRNETVSATGALSLASAVAAVTQLLPSGVVRVEHAGGAGYKTAAVASGAADAYIHDGRIRQWDVCGGGLFVTLSGGVVTDWLGQPHDYCLPHAPDAASAAPPATAKDAYGVNGIIAARDPAVHAFLLDVVLGRYGVPGVWGLR
jgi:fructose-1,6-bisphosphatase/inositol monophosphatase family enzyme